MFASLRFACSTGRKTRWEKLKSGDINTMTNIDSSTHVRGESVYLDDIPVIRGTLFGAAFGSPMAHGIIKSLDLTAAEAMPGVVRILTHKDVTGENQIGGIVPDDPLLAEDHVHYCGMPIAFILAETDEETHAAIKKITVDIDPLPIITAPPAKRRPGVI